MAEPIKDNEAVYDAEIAPLMDQIIAVCKRAGIPILASFQLTSNDEDGDGAMLCTTSIIPPRGTPGLAECLHDACDDLMREPLAFGVMISKAVQ